MLLGPLCKKCQKSERRIFESLRLGNGAAETGAGPGGPAADKEDDAKGEGEEDPCGARSQGQSTELELAAQEDDGQIIPASRADQGQQRSMRRKTGGDVQLKASLPTICEQWGTPAGLLSQLNPSRAADQAAAPESQKIQVMPRKTVWLAMLKRKLLGARMVPAR